MRESREKFNEKGELVDVGEPMELELELGSQPTIHEMMAQLIRSEEWRRSVSAAGVETFEESDDFEVHEEDAEPTSPHEFTKMAEDLPRYKERDLMALVEKHVEARLAALEKEKVKAAEPPVTK